MAFPQTRMRRLRQHDWSRRLARESVLTPDDLVWALVVTDSGSAREPVAAMPGVERLSPAEAAKAAVRAQALGVPALAIFPHIDPKKKNSEGSEATNESGLVPETVRAIKAAAPGIGVICDVALDPFTDHGHDGILENGRILNDRTVEQLVRQALVLVRAGADMVAPSDMMDGRIGAIRDAFEDDGHADAMILSYAAKYASAFYGPYREAIGTATALQGDKRTYQMDYAGTVEEALREVGLDLDEGADMVMVKPGLPYLDILAAVRAEFGVPTLAFQVSGEYAMITAAGQNGWIDRNRAIVETLSAFKRAGAAGIITYFAEEAAQLIG
jgi:porphobilinogen synthase